MTRREAMACLASAGVMRAQQAQALKTAAQRVGLVYGSCSDMAFSRAPAAYRELFFRHASLYAANLSWASIARTADAENYDYDPNVRPALDSGLKLTGAHFLWHLRTPQWIDPLTPEQVEKAVSAHIQNLGQHYRGQVYAWNVVNEAINPQEGRPDGLRKESSLLRILGPDFIELGFREARRADPSAMLIYNDYALELDTPEHTARRGAFLRLVDRLQAANTPIDGVGLQSHLRFDQWSKFSEKTFRGFLDELASRRLKIVVTELDVDDRGAPTDSGRRDEAVADVYRQFLAVTLDQRAVVALVTWGICDPYSWYNMPGHRDRYLRTDGTAHRPLLFDGDLAPKPAFRAVLESLEKAPPRK